MLQIWLVYTKFLIKQISKLPKQIILGPKLSKLSKQKLNRIKNGKRKINRSIDRIDFLKVYDKVIKKLFAGVSGGIIGHLII